MTQILEPTSTFVRPANTTAYAAGDLVANSATAALVVPMSFAKDIETGRVFIRRARIYKSGASVTNASFRLHLFKAAPVTITNGDNGAFSVSGSAGYVGAVDVTMDQVFTDGAFGVALPRTGSELSVNHVAQNLYGLIEALGAYTPASGETFGATLEMHRY